MSRPVTHPFARRLGDLLTNTAIRAPDKPGLLFQDATITWHDVDQRVTALAARLIAMQVMPGDRIGVMCTVRPEHVYATVAAVRVGAIAVGFNVLLTAEEVVKSTRLVKPAVMILLLADRDRPVAAPIMRALIDAGVSCRFILIAGEALPGSVALEDCMSVPSAEAYREVAARAAAVDEDSGALMLFTSGSTGEPKAAVLTHRNVIDNIAVQIRHLRMAERDRLLVHLPLSHAGGVTELLVPGLMLGCTLVLLERFHPARALELIERQRITAMHQVPTMYAMMFNLPAFADYQLSSLERIYVAGASTAPAIMAKMLKMAPLVITGYGMTEVAGFVTYTDAHDDAETISTTVGAIAPEFDLRIVDERRKPLGIGAVGEVTLRGSCLMQQYFRNPAATDEAVDAAGWFYTGDLGRLDSRGYLTLKDRRKLMYITGGYNVYPREVEDYLAQHPAVALAACIGVRDAVYGEVGAAYVVPKDDAAAAEAEMIAFCRLGLAEYKIPKIWVIRRELPLTSLGKIDRQRLIREHGGGV